MDSNLEQDFAKLTLSEHEDKDFEERVSKYPSSFDLKLQGLTKPKVKVIKDTLIGKLGNGFVLVDEEIQVYNLISYLCLTLEDIDSALDYNGKALRKNRHNGIALANRARYNRYQLNYYDAEEDLKRLESLYGNDNAKSITEVIAKGELAQSYARFGPKFHEAAIQSYETLFKDNPRVSQDILTLWRYDYCLTLRRTLHLFNKTEYPERDQPDTLKKTCKLLSEIIDTSRLKTYTARAWVELGQMKFQEEKNPATFDTNSVFDAIPYQKRYSSSKRYFEIALELDGSDFDVMEACAKFYRYFDRPEVAIRLFEEALKRRQTSLCYHHLALSIKKIELGKVNERKNQQKPLSRRRFGRGTGQTRTAHQTEQSNMRRAIKSGRNATQLPFNDDTRKILYNLQKAIELDPGNHYAGYDKAFLLRQLQMTEEAKVEFCKLVNRIELSELKISCYEQAAYCCMDLAVTDHANSRKYNSDSLCFLQRAIEIAAALAAKVKYTSLNVRPLVWTIKSMLTNPELIEAHDIQMQRLQNLLIQHCQLLPVTKEARSGEKSIDKILEDCLQDNNMEEAALLCILKEIASETNDEKFAQHLMVLLLTASTALSNGDNEAAEMRFQICYRLMGWRTHRENKEYDVFLMTDSESVNLEPMVAVSNWLKTFCGLNIVNSEENISAGEQWAQSLMNFTEKSTAIFVVIKDPKIDQAVEFVTTATISLEPERRPKLVILKDRKLKLPPLWANIPTVSLPDDINETSLSVISAWISNIYKILIKEEVKQ